MSSPILIKHLSGEPIGRFPVWMMRQAGRYLPSYRALREKHGFWEMVTTPALAKEVSLLPVRELAVDAVIFFSDILTLPVSVGIPIEMREGVGPLISKPLRQVSDFEVFSDYSPETKVPYIAETLRSLRNELANEIALIGFAGGPWSVACYLVQGRGKNGFEEVGAWVQRDGKGFETALSLLTDATIQYLDFQVRSGAQVLQLFDTWLSEMPLSFFETHYVPLLNRITSALKPRKVPLIYFAKNALKFYGAFESLGFDVVSVDSSISLGDAESKLNGRFSLQGNFDPELLLSADEATVRRRTRELVEEAKDLWKPPILNLGHGVLPQTPVENVRAFVDEARTLWV